MLEQVLAPFIGISVIAMALFALLLLGRRVRRNLDATVSTKRRSAYVAALRAGDEDELRAIARSIRRRRAAQADFAVALRNELDTLDGPRLARLDAAVASSGLGDRLIRQLGSRRAMNRGRAVLLTSRLRLGEAFPALASRLFDPDPDVRFSAAHGIAGFETDAAAGALIGALGTEAMPPQRIVEQLAKPWAVPALLDASRREDLRGARPLLTEALGLARDGRALARLTELLATGADEERVAACRALARLAHPAAFDAVVAAMDDEFDPVRAQAARALESIGDERAVAYLEQGLSDRFWWMRANCAQALRSLGERGNAALERAAHSTDRFARDRAQEALTINVALGRRRAEMVLT